MFQGLGAWMDVYDWSPTMAGGAPPLGAANLAGMAKAGVQTLYLQTAKSNRPETLLDQGTARTIIDRAHSLGMRVVGWYLPTHVDVNVDYARLAAITTLGVDGIAVDIESQAQPDIAVRNSYLLRISSALRRNYPAMPLGAITMSPVLLNQINPTYWPSFPWTELVKYYDVFMPMAYFTYQRHDAAVAQCLQLRLRQRERDPGRDRCGVAAGASDRRPRIGHVVRRCRGDEQGHARHLRHRRQPLRREFDAAEPVGGAPFVPPLTC